MRYKFNPEKHKAKLKAYFLEALELESLSHKKLQQLCRKHPKSDGAVFSKDQLITGLKFLLKEGELEMSKDQRSELLKLLKRKPIRSISGVLPVTVLTRPFPCPGKCIFCPNDVRMPKSYLADEPGAQRAERNRFDPYLQTYNRLLAFKNNGHKVSKIELIILGGTWSYYPESYQVWFIKRCFEAMNDFGERDQRERIKTKNVFEQPEKSKPEFNEAGKRPTYNQLVAKKEAEARKSNKEKSTWEDLLEQQNINETATARCVGLVIETRPDHIDEKEVERVRRLGATKTQIGYQSLNDHVLEVNHRGHDVAATERAAKLVRSAGFKLHIHWMPNLYGSDPEADKRDYLKLFQGPFVPDEVKIYPCSLIETAELMDYYEKGLWRPYTEAELLDVLQFTIKNTPRYVRLTRVIRDIPSQDIVVGNKKTNFRQIVENYMKEHGIVSQDIREREIKDAEIHPDELELKITGYTSQNVYGATNEYFLEYVNAADKICGFLRLSLPQGDTSNHFIEELSNCAIIREVHVYGVAQQVGQDDAEAVQHLGLGKKLIAKAVEIAKENDFANLAVISAIGTKEYYRKRGFEDQGLYQVQEIT